jgi:hypothetical protein
MYGEGYDWTPLYSVRSGQMVGAIPVGIETKGTADAPYWPNQICWTYKEVWTQPVGEWIWLMGDLSGPAIARGTVDTNSSAPVRFVNRKTGLVTEAMVDRTTGTFRATLPQGQYTVESGQVRTSLTALSAGSYHLDLRKEKAVEFSVSSKDLPSNEVLLQIAAEGTGVHTFTARVNNLVLIGLGTQQVDLKPSSHAKLTWRARVVDPASPWVAVLLPDNQLNQHQELTGIAASK